MVKKLKDRRDKMSQPYFDRPNITGAQIQLEIQNQENSSSSKQNS